VVDSWCPRLLTLFVTAKKQSVDFAGVFDNRGDGIAVVDTTATSQRARVALFNVLAPSNAARGIFPGSPLAPPNDKFDI